MSDTVPQLTFNERYYAEVADLAESFDRSPEDFIERSLRAGLRLSDILLSFPTVCFTGKFEVVAGFWEQQPLWEMPSSEGFRKYRQEDEPSEIVPPLSPDLVHLTLVRAERYNIDGDSFTDWSLDIGERWERSAGIGNRVRIVSGTTEKEITPLQLTTYPGEQSVA